MASLDAQNVGDTTSGAVEVSNPVMLPTAGATGKEKLSSPHATSKRHGRHRSKHKRSHSSHSSSHAATKSKLAKRSRSANTLVGSTEASNIVAVPAAPPLFDDAPLVNDDNMAGYVDRKARSILGVASRVVKMVSPSNQSRLTQAPYIHFTVRSSNDEHIRFRKDSLTLLLFATMKNQAAAAHVEGADQTVKKTAKRTALLAAESDPFMFIDPSVAATSFFSHVEVLIDNVPINSSFLMGGLWLQYVRSCEVFSNKDNTRLRNSKDLKVSEIEKPEYQALRDAVNPFHYGSWDSTTGRRVEANLRGVFPFEFKNEAAASADNLKEPNYTFPPNTTFDFRFHFHSDKFAAVFHPTVAGNMSKYFRTTGHEAPNYGVEAYEKYDIRYQITNAFLEYDSIVLRPNQGIEYLDLMRKGLKATYRYDVVRGQHLSMPSDQSYVDLQFTITPFARLLYVMFLPDWAVMSMQQTRRPLSGFSRFPENCSSLSMLFAGQKSLITPEFTRLGFAGEQHHNTHRLLYHYLKQQRVWSGSFDELFPPSSDILPFNQMLYVDLRESMSNRAENLNIRFTFGSGSKSPSNLQVVVLSVHSTGEVTCHHAGTPGHYDWRWESKY